MEERVRERLREFGRMKARMDREGLRSESLDAYLCDVPMLVKERRLASTEREALRGRVRLLEGERETLLERMDNLLSTVDEKQLECIRLQQEVDRLEDLLDDYLCE